MSFMTEGIVWEHYIDLPSGLGEQALAQIEGRLSGTLPEAIREVVLTRAGQVTTPEVLRMAHGRETSFGPILYAGGTKSHDRYSYSVEAEISHLECWSGQRIEDLKLFPFATNTARGHFCVELDNPVKPIVFVDFDYDPEEIGAVWHVADDFASLLSRLS